MIDFALQHWLELVPGAVVTLLVTAATVPLFLPLGLGVALGRIVGPLPVRWLAIALVDLVRGTPLLVQIFWVYYALPFTGVVLDAATAGVLTLVIHFGAYASEVFRGAIEAVPKSQIDAARVLGLRERTILRRVILPHALVISFPALVNQVIEVFKATSLLSIIAAGEIVFSARRLSSYTFQPTATWVLVGVFFFVLAYPTALALGRVESRLMRAWRS